MDEQGSVMRVGVAETIATELPVEFGRGRRAKTGFKKYYGAEWEGH